MTEWRSVLQAELAVPEFGLWSAAGRMGAAQAVAEVPLVAERNRMDRAQAAQLQTTPNKKLWAHLSVSFKSEIPRLLAAI